jgi:hypothetical protein
MGGWSPTVGLPVRFSWPGGYSISSRSAPPLLVFNISYFADGLGSA